MPSTVLLGPLDPLPVRPYLVHILDVNVPKYMGMPPDQFIRNAAGDFLEVKCPAFPGQLAMENNLQEQIAKFLFQFMVVAGFDGVEHLIDLFDRMPTQRHVVLLAVPGAALR